MNIKKVLIVYPYFTENIIAIFKKFGEIGKEIQFLCILPKKQNRNIYLSKNLNLKEINFSKNVALRQCFFFVRKNKNPIINPLCLLYNLLRFRPDIILFLDEAFSLNLFMTLILSKILGGRLYFYSFENIYKEYSFIKRVITNFIKKFCRD